MSEVSYLLSAMDAGVLRASGQLLPLVYEELDKRAASKMAQQMPRQPLQADRSLELIRWLPPMSKP